MEEKFNTGISWAEAKQSLFDIMNGYLSPMREKYNYYMEHFDEVEKILENAKKEAIEDIKFDKFAKEIEGLDQDLETFDKRINAIDDSTDSFSRNMTAMGEKTELYKGKVDILNKSIEEHKKMLDSTKTNISNVEHYLNSLGERTEENADEWDKASDCLEKYKDRQHDLENSLSGVQSELIETTNEIRNLSSEMAKAPFENWSKGLESVSRGFGTISEITRPLTTAISGIGIASLTTAIDFEQAMAKVQATAGVSSEELEILSEKARAIAS